MTRLAKHTRVVINHGMPANSKELISMTCHTVLADDRPVLMAIVPWQHSIHVSCPVRRDSRPVKAGTSAASAHDTVGKAHTSGQ